MKVKNTKSQKQHKTHKTETGTLAEEIETYGVNDLISFLEKQKGLDYDDAEIIRKEKINGHAFLKFTTKEFRDFGMPGGTAVILADFAKECKEKNTKSQKQHKTHKTETGTLAEEIETYGVNDLISFLEKQKGLDYDDAEIIRKEKINGHAFLKSTTKKFRDCGMPGGTAMILADFAKECKEKKSRAFSSYRTKKDLKEVLEKYGAGRIEDIPQFSPRIHKIDEKDESFLHCLKDIRIKLSNMGTVNQSNEAIRCEYISAILHACVHITKNLTGKYIRINPQFEIVGGESTGRVDYAIGALEELFCITEGKQFQIDIGFAQNIMQCESAYRTNKRKRKADDAFYDYIFGIVTTATEWYFLLYTPDGISCTSKNPLSIRFVESALKEGSEEEKELYKSVKRVMEVIVGLLKDRVDVEKMPVVKKQRVCSYFEE